ncbi:enamine deaminase RidA (YjgF/YER057c/UK114 family) [Kineococcus xinjiangensis]|uniref:Enamine deaminase RidA (YjgF/YER057c/UK114 family) n=1 Tax=Kineococcus xinjiangensis TaxID=512762 RepID=A0A2S6IF46_9ACTN|nr:RidA family protein [Kineococcus xinjiangensis]PPK92845.1 enamine deaminase RidA (YjgF/YER057c/UK114 family) [Kineococcus xinjiangensis]
MSAAPGSIQARLDELGLELPQVAAPLASYLPAVRDGDHVWTAGQLPFVEGKLPLTGKVGDGDGFVSPAQAQELARTCALNGLAAAAAVAGGLDAIERVVKVVGFVASDPSFTGQPGVVNGASNLLGDLLGDAGVHARSAVGVAVLPLDAPVEVEFVFRVR